LRPEIFFTAAREVEESFRPRAARSRTYRYWEAEPLGPLSEYRRISRMMVGDIDVRSFGRDIPPEVPLRRTVARFEVVRSGPGLRLEFEAQSFVWGMVRKLVAATREAVAGRLSLDDLRAAVAGERRLTLPVAEPEPLVLWDVAYDRPWTVRAGALAERQVEYFAFERRATRVREEVLGSLVGPSFPTDEASIDRRHRSTPRPG
jgi:tRNA U38,U39,U40 pseudouridine synthase TruA